MPKCSSCGTGLLDNVAFCSAFGRPTSNTDDMATLDFATSTSPLPPRPPSSSRPPSSRPSSSAEYLLNEGRFLPGRLVATSHLRHPGADCPALRSGAAGGRSVHRGPAREYSPHRRLIGLVRGSSLLGAAQRVGAGGLGLLPLARLRAAVGRGTGMSDAADGSPFEGLIDSADAST